VTNEFGQGPAFPLSLQSIRWLDWPQQLINREASTMKRTITAALIGLTLSASAALAAMPDKLSYVMLKEGEPVGTHEFVFTPSGDDLQVHVESHSRAEVFFMTFTYDHRRTETWKGGAFQGLTSSTDDDGTPHDVVFTRNGTGIDIKADGETKTLDGTALPVTLWNKDILKTGTLYSALDAGPLKIKITGPKREAIKINGKDMEADYYFMEGDLVRHLWYAPDGTFLKTEFKKKGFKIEWVLKP